LAVKTGGPKEFFCMEFSKLIDLAVVENADGQLFRLTI
jgi:hypothetical protein